MKKLIVRSRRLRELHQRIGTMATARHVWHRLTRARPAHSLPAIDLVSHYAFVSQPAFGDLPPPDIDPRSLIFFIPDFDPGSGGHLNIFRLIYHLESFGYRCNIAIVGHCRYPNNKVAQEVIRQHFFPLAAEVFIGTANLPTAYCSVASSWVTAYFVRAYRGAVTKYYFVQDFEPAFYAMGTDYLLAENTYRFGFVAITAGQWLTDKLSSEYGMRARAIGFAAELDRYQPRLRREPDARCVFFYARPPTPRRAFELGVLVLAEVARRLPDVRFILAGWDTSPYAIPFAYLNAGNVALDALPDLYSQCDVSLVLSCTNLSLLPLELMACGCCVVSNRGPNVEWLLNEDIASLADFTVEALSDAIVELLENPAQWQTQRKNAMDFVREGDWQREARAFLCALEEFREAQI